MSHHGNERQQTKTVKKFVFDSTNQDEGAWLQLDNYKIQKMTFQARLVAFVLLESKWWATFDPAAEDGGGGLQDKAGMTSQ